MSKRVTTDFIQEVAEAGDLISLTVNGHEARYVALAKLTITDDINRPSRRIKVTSEWDELFWLEKKS